MYYIIKDNKGCGRRLQTCKRQHLAKATCSSWSSEAPEAVLPLSCVIECRLCSRFEAHSHCQKAGARAQATNSARIELKKTTKVPAGKRRRINIRGKKGQTFSPPAGRLGGGPLVPASGNPGCKYRQTCYLSPSRWGRQVQCLAGQVQPILQDCCQARWLAVRFDRDEGQRAISS